MFHASRFIQQGRRAYRKSSDEVKEHVFVLVDEVKSENSPSRKEARYVCADSPGVGTIKIYRILFSEKTFMNPVRRPPTLGEKHKVFLVNRIFIIAIRYNNGWLINSIYGPEHL